MLKSIYIKNYALIDSIEIDFEEGFSVITGETGAGKSIILGALGLILGQRADVKSLKKSTDKCIVEGVFDVSSYNLRSFCDEFDIEYDPDTYVIRREIQPTGKSRAFINDSPVTINEIKLLGNQLIDIHSQHENLLLSNPEFQLETLDIIAANKAKMDSYKSLFKSYKETEKDLIELKEEIDRTKQDEELTQFQLSALLEAKLEYGQQEELESELQTLSHTEEIKQALYFAYENLSGDETGVVPKLKNSLNQISHISNVYSNAESIISRLNSSYLDLKDLSNEMEKWTNEIDFNPERLSLIQEKLNTIYNLQNRHKVTSVDELIAIKEKLETQISNLDNVEETIIEYEKKLKEQKKLLDEKANELTASRKKASLQFEKKLIERINNLGMANAKLECLISPKKDFDISGIDNVQFLFSANKNMPLQPIAEVASGGEISRFMLCLKSILAGAKSLPTIIFDEIDTGVSGEISDKMGKIMEEFGSKIQVIAITHQPQIAAKGKVHYKVFKHDTDVDTITKLMRLTTEQRLEELAGMLSGSKITDAAIENAKDMLGLK